MVKKVLTEETYLSKGKTGEDLEKNFWAVGASSAKVLRYESAGCIRRTGRRLVRQEMSSEKQGLVHGLLRGHPIEFEFDTEFDGSHWGAFTINGRVK